MSAFQEFARAVGEADRLIRTAPLHNSSPLPDDDLLKQIKDKLSDALSLHGDAAKDVRARAKSLDAASAATADDETAHLALSAPQTPPGAPDVPGDVNNPGPEPGSAPDLATFGDDPPAADTKTSRSSAKK